MKKPLPKHLVVPLPGLLPAKLDAYTRACINLGGLTSDHSAETHEKIVSAYQFARHNMEKSIHSHLMEASGTLAKLQKSGR